MDAIDEYSQRLVVEMRACGADVYYIRDGLSPGFVRQVCPTWVLVQYNPFRYGHWGFAPGLLRDAVRVRHGRHPVRIALMVHEAWVPILDWRTALMGLWQRLQLRILLEIADCVMASTESLTLALGGGTVHAPVGSNVTPADSSTEAARRALELGPGERLVIATFGRRHETRALGVATEAINAVLAVRDGHPTTILNLGADAPPLDLPAGADVRQPGPLSEHDLSLHLWASDLVLLPFTDGISTRRGTLMAALAHGRPVLALRSSATDNVLVSRPEVLRLTEVSDPGAYARAAVELSADSARRRTLGEAGRLLYAEKFDWAQVAARTMATLASAASSARVAQ
jgi:glycosyltransferase involved in cell wall biosynthesis